MLEIVHDIAPGAQLRFANFSTDLEFNAAVNFLAANSDVVVDDISWFGLPYDQTSVVSANTAGALDDPGKPIRGYYTSVGNQAQRHYEGTFVPAAVCLAATTTSCHQFAGSTDTTDALGLGPLPHNRVEVPSLGVVVVVLTWDDAFGSATSDYDLFLVDELTTNIVGVGGDDNTITKQPAEFAAYENLTGAKRWIDIRVTNYLGIQPTHILELFVFGGTTLGNGTKINFNTERSSVPAQSDAGGGVISVGAISSFDPGIDTIEGFSSRGPTNNGVIKPDAVAIDGVSVTGSGGLFPSTFFGTSAAAPHVAGLAALLLDQRPDLRSGESGDDPAADRAALRAAILDTAVDLGSSGVDNTYGRGRVNGLSAGQALAAPAAAPVPSLTAWALLAMPLLFGLFTAVGGRRPARQVYSLPPLP